ncbi:MAG: hypothetical protein QGH65_19190, partial [SAR324 cluster bacterium]|nr:hypothetical protein [SAR324 cluster bacterium]
LSGSWAQRLLTPGYFAPNSIGFVLGLACLSDRNKGTTISRAMEIGYHRRGIDGYGGELGENYAAGYGNADPVAVATVAPGTSARMRARLYVGGRLPKRTR